MTEQFVQVSPNSSGMKIRTEEVTAGGQTVEQQVISLADANGNLLQQVPVNEQPRFDSAVFNDQVIGADIVAAPALFTELRRIRIGLTLLLAQFNSYVDLTQIKETDVI